MATVFPKGLLVLLWIAILVAEPITSIGQPVPTSDVTGNWAGQCFGCAARLFTLKLVQKGSNLVGTIQTEGTPNFGDDEKPILNGKISGRKVTFQVRGTPGDLFDVELSVSHDGKTMNGNGSYRGSFGLKFTRDSQ